MSNAHPHAARPTGGLVDSSPRAATRRAPGSRAIRATITGVHAPVRGITPAMRETAAAQSRAARETALTGRHGHPGAPGGMAKLDPEILAMFGGARARRAYLVRLAGDAGFTRAQLADLLRAHGV